MTTFPIQGKQDSAFFKSTPEDPTIRHETEGGYVVTRPRHTRPPRRTFTTGFTEISNANKLLLDAFYDEVKGGSLSFEWTHPVDLTVHLVRIKGGLKCNYVGEGDTASWTTDPIELEEV